MSKPLITKEDIKNFALKQNIDLTNNEIDVIYTYIENDINNPLKILSEIKDKVKPKTYETILTLYNTYKR